MTETPTPQHAPDCTFDEATDEPEMGFGLAGGGYGAYSYCPICGVILHKTQEVFDGPETGSETGSDPKA